MRSRISRAISRRSKKRAGQPEMGALVLTYHAVEDGPAPLCIEPRLFAEHVACIAASGVPALSVSELVEALRAGEMPDPAIAVTFDDGCASAVRVAAPMLVEHSIPATFFCVAGHLGGFNDWPTQPARTHRLELASAGELAELVQAGFEIGSHGFGHAPLGSASSRIARKELEESKRMLETQAVGPVLSFAYPYGVHPSAAARELVKTEYAAACVGGTARVVSGADPYLLPRVDAHYLRRTAVFRRVLAGGLTPYLSLRAAAARARRLGVSDYEPAR